MNDQNYSSSSSGGYAPSPPGPSGPVPPSSPPRTPPTPPPPPHWGHYPPPPPRRGVFAMLGRLVGALGVAAVLFAAGFYVGLFALVGKMGAGSNIEEVIYEPSDEVDPDKIAIIPIEGMIEGATAEFIHDSVSHAIRDDKLRAVVIRVDSGGGLVGPSEQIWHEFTRLRRERPDLRIIASYGSIAASGGYYVSCDADYIFAQRNCITGSIGVIAQVLTLEDLMTNKLGIQPVTLTASQSVDKETANNIFRNWTEADRAELRHILDAMHERFAEVVRLGRVDRAGAMPADQVGQVATGKAFLAGEALEAGLIDEVGYLEDAIDRAGEESGLTSPQVVRYARPAEGLLYLFLKGTDTQPMAAGSPLPRDAAEWRKLINEMASPQMMYLYAP